MPGGRQGHLARLEEVQGVVVVYRCTGFAQSCMKSSSDNQVVPFQALNVISKQ
jgi:hypothetical protein